MKNAKDKLDKISEDERVRRLAELREKAIMDEKEAEYTGYCNGLEEGIEQGIEQGAERKNKEIAKKMKEKGADIEFIIEITGLSEEEILKL